MELLIFLIIFPLLQKQQEFQKKSMEKDIETINNIREQILSSENNEIFWEEPLSSRVMLFLKWKGYSFEKVCVKVKYSYANVPAFKISWED